MIKNAWRILAAVGVIAVVGASGCVVGSSDDESGGSGGSLGGAKGGGGSGGSTGGSGGSTGGVTGGGTGGVTGGGTGGVTGGTGGTGGTTDVCGASGQPASCEPEAGSTDPCALCIKGHCCTEYGACVTNNACLNGAPDGKGEIFCMQACYIKETTQNGLSGDDAKNKCGADCVTPTCGTIASETSEAFACLDEQCPTECLAP